MQSRREVQRRQSHGSQVRFWRNVILIIVILILAFFAVYGIANHPRAVAKSQAIKLAKQYGGLKSTSGFYIYNRDETYYSVSGKNSKGQNILVIVPQKGGSLRVEKMASGLSATAVRQMTQQNKHPKRILKVAPGVFNNRVVWEVTYRNRQGQLCYDLISFKTGKYISQINNI